MRIEIQLVKDPGSPLAKALAQLQMLGKLFSFKMPTCLVIHFWQENEDICFELQDGAGGFPEKCIVSGKVAISELAGSSKRP